MKVDEQKWAYALGKVKGILDNANVEYWLELGTLLGAVRDHKFISYDSDIDIGMLCADSSKVIARISEFESKGFKVDITDNRICLSCEDCNVELMIYRSRENVYWDLHLKQAPKFARVATYFSMIGERLPYINHLQKRNKQLLKEKIVLSLIPDFAARFVRSVCFKIYELFGAKYCAVVVPKHFYDNLDWMRLYGIGFSIPSNVEDYLALRYGKDWGTPDLNYVAYSKDKTIDKKFDVGSRTDLMLLKCRGEK